MYTQDLE
ncbi:rCG49717 [Rattus norvegicus]|nr:rCG49717 [Rattus norvegicus]